MHEIYQLSFNPKMVTVISVLLLATVTGFLNAYVGWLSPIIHLLYLFFIVMIIFLLSLNRKLAKKNWVWAVNARYFLSNMVKGKPNNNLMIIIVWLIAAIIISVQILCSVIVQTEVFRVIDVGINYVMLAFSVVINIGLALLLSRSIRAIN